MGLLSGQNLGCEEISEILVICDNINWKSEALQVMSPGLERLKYCQEFLVMNIVIQLRRGESARMESDWVEFGIGGVDGKNCSESVIGGVSFNDDL